MMKRSSIHWEWLIETQIRRRGAPIMTFWSTPKLSGRLPVAPIRAGRV